MSTATYIGNTNAADGGEWQEPVFFEDIPARDLTAAEYAALTPEQQTRVQNGKVYIFNP